MVSIDRKAYRKYAEKSMMVLPLQILFIIYGNFDGPAKW